MTDHQLAAALKRLREEFARDDPKIWALRNELRENHPALMAALVDVITLSRNHHNQEHTP